MDAVVTKGFFSTVLGTQYDNEFSSKRGLFCSSMVSRKSSRINRISCKVSGGGIEENPTETSSSRNKMEEYNVAMKRMMRNPYEYHHDLGMNYTHITHNLIVGSQPQKCEDIDHLKQEENVAYILNLQQDKDIEYWGIDLVPIVNRCKEVGIRHMRRPVS